MKIEPQIQRVALAKYYFIEGKRKQELKFDGKLEKNQNVISIFPLRLFLGCQ